MTRRSAERDRFYRERDSRTTEYEAGLLRWVEAPVAIAIGPAAAETRAGQIAVLAAVNIAARLHRNLILDVPRVPLVARSLVPARSLDEAAEATVRAIDPYGQLATRRVTAAGLGLAIACDIELPVHVGWSGLAASVGTTPQQADASERSVLGAALAACIGTAALVRAVTGGQIPNQTASLTDFSDQPGGACVQMPVDVGDVLVVGAGAVASALLYWLRELGVSGRWVIVDRDDLLLLNTNRAIGSLVEQTEWYGRTPSPKAIASATLIGAEPRVAWYDEWLGAESGFVPSLVLPLANDRNVRQLVGYRGEPLLVHATTSRNWTAELHRHVAGVDECIACRFPGSETAAFACSTAPLPGPASRSTDAALPFLSAAAGLLLARALMLHMQGRLVELDRNFIRLGLGAGQPGLGRFARQFAPARTGCAHVASPDIRAALAAAREGIAASRSAADSR
ncbi:MAG: hypothetical protein U0838_06950 [Chloroflexota bacterium]